MTILLLTACLPAPEPEPTAPPCELLTFYVDGDLDGVGSEEVQSCDWPEGAVESGGDCDDTDPDVSPWSAELCNGRDDDCDGLVDDEDDGSPDSRPFVEDGDGDGHAAPGGATVFACEAPLGYAELVDDCDDTDGSVYPGAPETCDGVDDDCDGFVDEEPTDGVLLFLDIDGDGWGGESFTICHDPGGFVSVGGDCDDEDPLVSPEGTETCNGLDDDCDGVRDQGFPASDFWPDGDGDGWGTGAPVSACTAPPWHAEATGDCDDLMPGVYPGALELCDGVDQDCDGTTADETSDEDGDGFAVCDDDCDDTSASAMPGGTEVCNGVDDDCDGRADQLWDDVWEPNDDVLTAPFVAQDDETVVLTPTFAGHRSDWFAMDVVDDPGTVPDAFLVWADLTDIPPGVEVALHLYRTNNLGQIRYVMTDDTWQDGALHVERTGLWLVSDGNPYFVHVEVLAGTDCASTYTLTLGNIE